MSPFIAVMPIIVLVIARFHCQQEQEAGYACRHAAFKAATITPRVGLARYMQDPIKCGHRFQYLPRTATRQPGCISAHG
jgi:hypothetical protein